MADESEMFVDDSTVYEDGRLRARIAELEAMIAAMRPLVVALAGPGGPLNCNEDGCSCVFCEAHDWMPEGRYADVRHTPDCPVTRARALKQRMGW